MAPFKRYQLSPDFKTVLFGFVLMYGSCLGQSWQQGYDQAWEYYDQGEYEQTLEIGQKILEESDSDLARLFVLKLLSATCAESGNYELGIEYGLREIDLSHKVDSPDSVKYNSYNSLTANLISAEEYDTAIKYLHSSKDLAVSAYGEKSYEFNYTLSELGLSHYFLNNLDSALYYMDRANQVFVVTPEWGLDFLNNLYLTGLIYFKKEDIQNAGETFLGLKGILEANDLQNELIYAETCEDLGIIQYQDENYPLAEETLFLALDRYAYLGYEPAETPEVVNTLALALIKTDQLDVSDSLLALLGDENTSRNILINQLNLANQKYSSGKYAEAVVDLREILEKTEHGPSDLQAEAILLKIKLDYELNHPLKLEEILLCELAFNTNFMNVELSETLYYKSKFFQEHHQPDAARSAINHSLELALSIERDAVSSKVFIEALKVALVGDEITESKKLYERIRSVAKFEDPATLDKLAYNYAILLYGRNFVSSTLQVLNSISVLPVNNQNIQYHLTLLQILLDQQRLAEATNSLDNVKSSPVLNEFPLEISAELLNYEARIHLGEGHYSRAEQLFNNSILLVDQASEIGPDIEASIRNSSAIFYQTVGNYTEAKMRYGQAFQLIEPDSPLGLDILQNMATLQQMEGDYENSIETLKKALAGYENIYGNQHPSYAVALQNLATAHQKMENYDEAIALIQEAIGIDETNNLQGTASYLNKRQNLGVLYMDAEQLEQAEAVFKEVVPDREKLLGASHPDYIYSLYIHAVVLQRIGKIEEAKVLFDSMIEKYKIQVRDFFPYLSEREKSSYYSKIQEAFKAYLDFKVEYAIDNPSATADLFDFQLEYKAALLNSSMDLRQKVLNSQDDELLKMYDEWRMMKENISKLMVLTQNDIVESGQDISSLQERANQIEKQLTIQSKGIVGGEEKEVTWRDIQSRLAPDQAAVELLRIRKNMKNDSVWYVALIVKPDTRDHPEMEIYENGINLEKRLFSYYRNATKFQVQDTLSYDNYWIPLAGHLEGYKTIFVAPDGIFNKMNMATLYDTSSKTYILDERNIHYLTNLSELIPKRESEQRRNRNVYLFGNPSYDLAGDNPDLSTRGPSIDPLPGTAAETETIEDIFSAQGWPVNLLSESEASEANFKQMKETGILHVASHGFFLSDSDPKNDFYSMENNPLMRSGLLFSGAQNTYYSSKLKFNTFMDGEDGVLTAYEVLNMDFQETDLVVLSACETGLGEVKNGEGVYGLQRAFIIAGANSVVISLWKVDDEATRDLMTSFYRHFLDGMTKYESLTLAQREMREKYQDPLYWGAFVLCGI